MLQTADPVSSWFPPSLPQVVELEGAFFYAAFDEAA